QGAEVLLQLRGLVTGHDPASARHHDYVANPPILQRKRHVVSSLERGKDALSIRPLAYANAAGERRSEGGRHWPAGSQASRDPRTAHARADSSIEPFGATGSMARNRSRSRVRPVSSRP